MMMMIHPQQKSINDQKGNEDLEDSELFLG